MRVIVVRSAGASAARPPQLLPASPRLPLLKLEAPSFVRSFVRCEPPASASRRRLPRRRCRCRCRLGVPVAVAGRPPPPQVASARQRLLTWLSPPRRVVPRARPPARHGPINPLALPPRFVPHRTHRPDRARDRQSTTPHATPVPSFSLSLTSVRPLVALPRLGYTPAARPRYRAKRQPESETKALGAIGRSLGSARNTRISVPALPVRADGHGGEGNRPLASFFAGFLFHSRILCSIRKLALFAQKAPTFRIGIGSPPVRSRFLPGFSSCLFSVLSCCRRSY